MAEGEASSATGPARWARSAPSALPPAASLAAGSRSEDVRELEAANHDTGRWCLEVLQALKLVGPAAPAGPPPLHIGLSFGGAALLDLAVVAPQAIRAAALVVPGGLLASEPAAPAWVEQRAVWAVRA